MGRDRHGLHEPQPGRARRPRVRLHPDPARRRPQDGRRATSSDPALADRIGAWVRAAAGRSHLDGCGWPGSATTCATSPSPRATRSRPSCGSASRSTPTGSTTWSHVVDAVPRRRVDALVAEYDDTYRVAPELRAGGERHESLRYAARIELGLRAVPRATAGSARSPPTSRTSAGCASCPGLAVQRLMADGYGFGGEGDWKTSVLLARRQGDGRRRARRAPRSWRTTPTTSGPGEQKILGAHMLEVCPTIAAGHAVAARSTRWASATGRTRSGWSSTPLPAPASSSGWPTSATGSGWWPTRSTSSPPDEPLPKLPVARAVWKPAPELRPRPSAG